MHNLFKSNIGFPEETVLLSRLRWPAKPGMSLNPTQIQALGQFQHKLAQQIYTLETTSCLCGHPPKYLLSEIDRYGLPVSTYLCDQCGMLWSNPRLTEHSLQRFYDEDYRLIYGSSHTAPEAFFNAQIRHGRNVLSFVKNHFHADHGQIVFDIGCGAGGMLKPFQDSGCRTLGCDLGCEYLKHGRAKGLELLHGSYESLTLHAPADFMIVSHVLEHFPHPRRSLQDLATLLKPGAYLYVELPGIFNIHRMYGDILLFLQNAHLYHFTLTTLSNLLAEAGFKLIKGDETIRALFRKESHPVHTVTSENPQKVLAYLQTIERFRWLFKSRRYAIKLIRKLEATLKL